jgi:hypothetical protein
MVQSDPREPVREYLEALFPNGVIQTMDPAARGPVFRIVAFDRALRHEVVVESRFLQQRTPAEIRRFLSEHQLPDVLSRAGTARVEVDDTGIAIPPGAGEARSERR